MNMTRTVAALAMLASTAGCISFGEDPPETLFTLTPREAVVGGRASSGLAEQAIAVSDITAPRKLAVMRIPVQVDDANLAYLQDAQWVELPARLFSGLLAETMRANSNRLVVESGDAEFAADTQLTGMLQDMGYDARTGEVVVTFDAMLRGPTGIVRTQRFQSRVVAGSPEAASVAPALNQAANDVAIAVAAWAQG